jgi:hypothetical protein
MEGSKMMVFSELTKAQLRVFEQIATGSDTGHPQRTLDSLEARSYIQSEFQQLVGFPPVAVRKYSVPIPVHIEWCQWCSEQLKGKENDLE